MGKTINGKKITVMNMPRYVNGHTRIISLIIIIAVSLMTINISATTLASVIDIETADNNTIQAWNATLWTQTSQVDFEAGVVDQVDTSSSPGDVVLAEEVTVNVVASDDFESGDWSGGSGWLWEWYTENSPLITTAGSPHGGSYHLQMPSNGDYYYIARPTNMTGKSDARLRFWAKADSFGGADFAQCTIYDGSSWNTVATWTDGDDDNTYHYYDIDLSSYVMSSEFYVTFYAELAGTGADFYIDDLSIIASWVQTRIADDDFESGGWSGGSGWLWGWWNQGDSAITSSDMPHGGTYHLRLRSSTGYVDRAVDLSGHSNVRLQFWAKADSFESGEYVECMIYDGIAWDVVATWVDGDDDNIYHFFDIDLSGYDMSSVFYIAFDAQLSNTHDYFYVDDLQILEPAVYYASGTVASQVLDTGIGSAVWDGLFWDETLESNTDITFEVRASDAPFSAGDVTPAWNDIGGTSPVVINLPSGRYQQWRATLTASDTDVTPVLHEVRLYYY
jgi:hypothetical protein